MKKILLVTLLLGGIITTISSCKKNYTCTCTVVGSGTINGTATWDTLLLDQTKKDAEDICSSNDYNVSGFGQTNTQTCVIN